MDEIEKIAALIANNSSRELNEADTRHQIIDVILHDILKWPRNRTPTEEFIAPGYADYVLKKQNGEDLLFIEAKKEGAFFELPQAYHANENSGYITIAKLISDPAIRAAIMQVRTYCFDTGCEAACITNGHEWIFFRTFQRSRKWESLKAFVIRRLEYFRDNYTSAINSLGFIAITEHLSLNQLLQPGNATDRPVYNPKEKIPSYGHTISSNKLAGVLRPIINRYFGVIEDSDSEFMDRCYVSQRDYFQTTGSMHSIIQDTLTPYFQDYGVQQLDDTGKGGRIGGRITKNLKHGRQKEVLVLFGGKGSGKSTFIKRLLFHAPPKWLREHATISIVDLLQVPEDKKTIRTHIWKELVAQIDKDGLLNGDRDSLLELFNDRYEIAKKQELFGLPETGEIYNLKLNTLVSKWKADQAYSCQRLVDYWKLKSKGIVVVIDNTDQYSSELQDFCFASAQEISNLLSCITIISMREERFFHSKIHGLLDAFQNSGFHISSPKPAEVFKKRLSYTISLLRSERLRRLRLGEMDGSIANDCARYLAMVLKEFENERSPLNSFLTACAHGDTRLSLDLFRSFILSGYTNVDEMLNTGSWNFQIHQVIKPVMIPNRYFYDETLSNIPNIYQLRHSRNGSHFTGLRILRKLGKSVNSGAPAYMSTVELVSYFSETFMMAEDLTTNLDLLLKHGFVESSNRLDLYSPSVDAVKITNYGAYMLKSLAANVTYLDLVSTDCGIYDELASNQLIDFARREFNLFMRRKRLERVEVRLQRVEEFIGYLEAEEQREREQHSLGMPPNDMFTFAIRAEFVKERDRILASARRQRHLNDA